MAVPLAAENSFYFCTYIDIADNHRVAIRVQEVLALWISAENDRLASGGAGQRRIDELCNERRELNL